MLNIDLFVTKEVTIKADVKTIWKAITDPDTIKRYFMGVDVQTTWKAGDAIYFSGKFKGQTFRDKGTIVEIKRHKLLKYDYWSSWSGLEDKAENYSMVTYSLESKGEQTDVQVVQVGFASETNHKHAMSSWDKVLKGLKEILEG